MPKAKPAIQPEKPKPVHVVDFFPIRATIWQNDGGEEGRKWYSTTVTKTYRLENGGGNDKSEYRQTHSLSAEDLLPAAKALEQAFEWIQLQRKERTAESRQSA